MEDNEAKKLDFDVAIGRIVTYLAGEVDGEPRVVPAMIVKLWGGDTVNLVVFSDGDPPDPNGVVSFGVTSVVRGDGLAQWLPYAERNIAVP